jgi:branched-chain amino acid transport system substrate-binding protein
VTDTNQPCHDRDDDGLVTNRKAVSRREFLKIAGAAGAVVGAGASLSGLLAACGGKTTTTSAAPATTAGPATTASPTTTAAPATTTTAAPATTTSAGPEAGREIKVGVISPLTGILAVFAVADRWGVGLIKEFLGDNMVLGDGKSHKVSWLLRDTQSDDNRASQVTSDLILNDKADLLLVGGSPTTAVPAAVMAETAGAPLLAMNCPWQAWIFGRKLTLESKEKWVYGCLFGVEQGSACAVQVLNKIPTNKKVGLFFGNTIDTDAWLAPGVGMQAQLEAAGYQTLLPSRFNLGTEDFTSLISAYKKFGCEINAGSNPGKDFPNFWNQCKQQGYTPKACIEMIGLSATEDQVAAGPASYGVIMIFTWHKDWPYKDSITGMTNVQLADRYEKDLNKPWDQFITGYARMAWGVDVLKRTKNFDDRESVLEAIRTTKTELITGPVDFTQKPDPKGRLITPNVWKCPVALGQMQKGTKWPVEVPMVAIIDGPEVPASAVHKPFVMGTGPQQVG